MGLTDDDVREILRIIDESRLDELRIETEGFSLHVPRRDRRGCLREGPPRPLAAPAAPPAPPAAAPAPAARGAGRNDGRAVADARTFYRAEAPGRRRSWRSGRRWDPTARWASSRS